MLKVVFCGTPDISTNCLQVLHDHESIEVVYVISQPDRPSGRGNKLKSPEVIELAKSLELKTFQTQNINKELGLLNQLEALKPDLFIVFAFAQFLGKRVLQLPKLGCFNIHTSLLPRYRGAAPIHYAILNGDKITGVSIQRMVKQMDAGDICCDSKLEISPFETTESLYQKLKVLAATTLNSFLDKVLEDKLTFTPQIEDNATFAPTISKQDGYIDFHSESAEGIERKRRAFTPWPGLQILVNKKRCKLLELNLSSKSLAAGSIELEKDYLHIGCASGSIRVDKLQMEGKQASDISTWINGLQGQVPTIEVLPKDQK